MPQYQGVWNLQDAARLQSQQQWVTDPNFRNTTLLLQADNAAGGAQNNTFLDSSSNNFAITRNGNTTQGTFTPFSQGWSNYFNGSGAFLETAASSSLTPSTTSTPFTVEAWVYNANPGSGGTVVTFAWVGNGNIPYTLAFGGTVGVLDNTGRVFFGSFNGSSWAGTSTPSAVPLNAWVHLAGVYTGTTFNLYVNGVLASSNTASSATGGTNVVYLGRRWDSGQDVWFTGYISNARVVIGTAVYTANFTPSTAPLQAITNTQLLTCQSNRFIDTNTQAAAKTITVGGAPSVQPFAPFAPQFQYTQSVIGGSGYFDGSGDYLSVAGNSALSCDGNIDFCVEAWVYSTASGVAQVICQKSGISGTSFSNYILYIGSGNNLCVSLGNSGSPGSFIGNFFNSSSTNLITPNRWAHVVWTKRYVGGGNVNEYRLFVNGKLEHYFTQNNPSDARNDVFTTGIVPASSDPFNGYITGVRVTKNSIPTSYQTTSTTINAQIFTIPSAPPTTTSQGASSPSILLNFTNAGIIDGTMDNVLETVGNAQVSTSVVKYGSGSLAFDGTGDWLLIPHTADQFLSTGAFTIEMWVYRNASGTYGLVGKGTGTTGWLVSLNSSNQVVFTFSSSMITSTGTVSSATWTHIAVVREGTGTNQTKIYINGSNDGTGTVSTDFVQTNAMYVGADRTGGSAFNGYLDDLRITKGVARYLSNFTPPQVALPRQ